MSIIGTFTKQENGSYRGAITVPALKGKANIVPVEKSGESAPDFRVYLGNFEAGAAWSATSKEGKAYLSVKLDPVVAEAFYCRLVEMDKGHSLIFTR